MSTHTNAIASSSKPPKSKDPKDPSRKKSKKSKTINADGGAVPDAMGSSVAVDGATPIPPPTSKKHKHSKKDKSGHGGSAKGPFQHQRSNMRMSIAPKFSADQLVGVREALDGLVMRYVPQLQGVLLAHWDHTFQDDTVQLISECPFGIAEVEFDSIIWAPKIGQKLYGTHSLSSPSHLSLLFNKTFNISIPLQHIPLDQYEFEATDPADLDADADADDTDSEDEDEAEELGLRGLTGFGMAKGVEEVGRWKVKSTGKLVGEGGKGVKFTVIGMQVTNQMLSLTGSLLSDPSDPPALSSLPVPSSSSASATAAARARVDSPTPEPPSFPSSSQRPTKRPANASTKAQAKANAKAIITDKTPVAPSTSAPAPSSAKKATTAPATAAAPAIDPQYLSARDQKKLRKEEEKRKRDARKERKGQVPGQAEGEEGLDLEGTVAQGGEASVSMDGREEQVQVQLQQGTKRKMEGEEGRKKKKERKE